MSSRRTLILIAAVVVGAIAAYALFTYIGGIEDNANNHAERVKIYKIVKDIPKGTFGDDAFAKGLIKQDTIAKEYRPATAINDPAEISGLVSISDLPANQVVVTNQFVSQAQSLSSFSSLLKKNEVAVTISVDQVHGVAGLLVPGDFVNILVTGTGTQGGSTAANSGGAVYAQPSRFLFQKVQILAIGQERKLQPGETASTNADGSTATSTTSGLITFAVPAEAAQKIASVAGGSIYLTLVPKDYQPTPLPPIDPNAPLPGEDGAQLTPYGPKGRPES